MRLASVHIRAFKSIMDLEIRIDPNITVLIGPNESGKTNILKAIEAFNPGATYSKDFACQYSPYFEEGRYPEITIEYTALEPKEKVELAKAHLSLKEAKAFRLKKCGPRNEDYFLLLGDKEIPLPAESPIFSVIPKNLYFDHIPLIKNSVRLQELESSDPRFQGERDLLHIGGVTHYHEIFEDTTRGRRRREEVSRFITEKIREVWSQDNSLEFKFNVNGDILHFDISDKTTVYDSPQTRSFGFWWFLSFYVSFMTKTLKDVQPQSYVYLIEEPGIHLHPAGQKDLVRLLEILGSKFQIVYTTHSPFMINRAHPQRVRLVSKNQKGTEVDNEAYRENWKPLRNAIGLMVGDLFFFGDSGVLLEIPTKKIPFVEKMRSMRIWRDEEQN